MPNVPFDNPHDNPGGSPDASAAGARPDPPRRVTMQRRGPILVDGPVEVELEDGSTVFSDRFRVALCTCRRSRRYPWCDTSHRDRG